MDRRHLAAEPKVKRNGTMTRSVLMGQLARPMIPLRRKQLVMKRNASGPRNLWERL